MTGEHQQASGALPARSPFPWLPAIVLLGALAVFAVVALEIGARLYGIARGDLNLRVDRSLYREEGVYRLDPDAGYTMKPNIRMPLVTDEYQTTLVTNARGLIGPEIPVKAENERRIVVLGDSYTAATQVEYQHGFTAQLQRLLEESAQGPVRVINVATGGWSTFNQAGFLRANVDWLQPDVVVVAAYVGNDVGENVFATRGGYELLGERSDGLGWGEAATALLQQSVEWFPTNGLPPRQRRSRLGPGDALPTPVPNPTPEPGAEPEPPSDSRERPAESFSFDSAREFVRRNSAFYQLLRPQKVRLNLSSFEWLLLREYPEEYWIDVAWPLTGKYLSEIDTLARAQGARTALMLIPHITQFDERWYRDMLSRYGLREQDLDLDRPQREFRQLAEPRGIPVLDLLPVFRNHPRRGALYLKRDTHFTALAHRVTAEQLATLVAPLIGPP